MSVFGKVGKKVGEFLEFVIDGQKVRFPSSMSDKQIEQAISNKIRFQDKDYIGEYDISEIDAYHGTDAQFDVFDVNKRGNNSALDTGDNISLTWDYGQASNYAKSHSKKDATGTWVKKGGYYRSRYDDELGMNEHFEVFPQVLNVKGVGQGKIKVLDWSNKPMDSRKLMDAQNRAKEEGYAGVEFRGIKDDSYYNPMSRNTDTIKVFSPKNLSIKDRNLLASAGGLGFLATTEEDAEAGIINKAGKQVIEAWHGSPHDFDKFSLDKIGTGEGAQAYGHGLYFADAQDVAKSYRDQFNVDRDGEVNEMLMELLADADTDEFPPEYVVDTLLNNYLDGASFSRMAENMNGEYGDWAKRLADSPPQIQQRFKHIAEKRQGSLYNVHIDATPDELLDWDAPLSEQSDSIKSKLLQLDDPYITEAITTQPKYNDSGDYWEYMGETYESKSDALADITPEDFFRGRRGNFSSPSDVSEKLKEKGIKGIQYADGMTRHGDKSSKNYVAFDDKIISIAKKYGIAPGAVTAAMIADEEQASAWEFPETQLIPRTQSDAIGIPEGWRSDVHGTGMWLKQNLDFPLGGTWFEGLGDYLTDLAEGQEKSAFEKYLSGLFATLDVLP